MEVRSRKPGSGIQAARGFVIRDGRFRQVHAEMAIAPLAANTARKTTAPVSLALTAATTTSPISTQTNHLVSPCRSELARILWRIDFKCVGEPAQFGGTWLAGQMIARDRKSDSAGFALDRWRRVSAKSYLNAEKQALPENSPGTSKLIFSRRNKGSLPRGSAMGVATTNLPQDSRFPY